MTTAPSCEAGHGPGRLRIGLVADGVTGPYECGIVAGARREADRRSVDLQVADSGNPTARAQIAALQEAVSAHARAVIVVPADYGRLILEMRSAHDQGVRVVVVGSPPQPNPGLAWAFVGPDLRPDGTATEAMGVAVGSRALDAAVAGALSQPVADQVVGPAGAVRDRC